MDESSLLGQEILVEIADPWELSQLPSQPVRRARILEQTREGNGTELDVLTIGFDHEILYRGKRYREAAAVGDPLSVIDELCTKGVARASLYGIPIDAQRPLPR